MYPSAGLDDWSELLSSLNCRCLNGQLYWIFGIRSEYGGGLMMTGVWYKAGGYTPEGKYLLVQGGSPPGTDSSTDFPEYAANRISMTRFVVFYGDYPAGKIPGTVPVLNAPVIYVLPQIALTLLPLEELTSVLGNTNNYVRYLNPDSNGINGTFYLTDGTNNIYASSDGYTWSVKSTISGAGGITDITYGNGVFVATSKHRISGTASIYVSGDAVSWAEIQVPLSQSDGDLTCVTYGAGTFLACLSDQTGNVTSLYSADGTSWTEVTTLSPATTVKYINSQFIILAKTGQVAASYDAITWTAGDTIIVSSQAFDIAFAPLIGYVATSLGYVYTSLDLTNWQRQNFPETASIVAIEFGAFTFVAVTATGNAYRSPDGKGWMPMVCYGQQKWTGEDSNDYVGHLSAGLTIPAINGTVTATVGDVRAMYMFPGRNLWISDGTHVGSFTVESVPSITTLVLKFTNLTGSSAPGDVIASQAKIRPYFYEKGAIQPIYFRASGQFTRLSFYGFNHAAVYRFYFPGVIQSVTYYPDIGLFIAQGESTADDISWYNAILGQAGTTVSDAAPTAPLPPPSGVPCELLESPGIPSNSNPTGSNTVFWSIKPVNGEYWKPYSPSSPAGRLKSIVFQQGSKFVLVE